MQTAVQRSWEPTLEPTLQGTQPTSDSFTRMLAKSAIVGMESLLGPGPANSLLFHSRILYNLSDPAAVHHRLRSLLGNGSKVVEESIVSQIYRDLGLPAPKGEFDFAACISLAATIHRTREVDLV